MLAALALLATGCGRPASEEPGGWSPEQLSILLRMALPTDPPASPSNRYADHEGAAELGRALFFDPGLSADGSVSCASCHKPSLYFTDGQPTAVGLQAVERHTPTVLGATAYPFVGWDGHNDSLWSQALGPLEDPEEMGSHRLLVLRRIDVAHRAEYERVFGALPPLPDGLESLQPESARELWEELDPEVKSRVTDAFVNAGKSIEAYERRLHTGRAPFDEYVEALRSGDAEGGGHLTPAAVRGLEAFLGEASCIHCHNGPFFTDLSFHNLGLPSSAKPPDTGRADGVARLLANEFRSDGPHADGTNPELAYIDSSFADAMGAFKTPSLRNVAVTAPYGHRGQFTTLEQLLDAYREDRPEPVVGHLDPLLTLVSPDFDVSDMKAFLESLTGAPSRSDWWRAPLQTRRSVERD